MKYSTPYQEKRKHMKWYFSNSHYRDTTQATMFSFMQMWCEADDNFFHNKHEGKRYESNKQSSKRHKKL